MTDLSAIDGPRVNYSVSLADLALFADAAAELDAYQSSIKTKPAERARIISLIERVHDAVERAARDDGALIYAADDGSELA